MSLLFSAHYFVVIMEPFIDLLYVFLIQIRVYFLHIFDEVYFPVLLVVYEIEQVMAYVFHEVLLLLHLDIVLQIDVFFVFAD